MKSGRKTSLGLANLAAQQYHQRPGSFHLQCVGLFGSHGAKVAAIAPGFTHGQQCAEKEKKVVLLSLTSF